MRTIKLERKTERLIDVATQLRASVKSPVVNLADVNRQYDRVQRTLADVAALLDDLNWKGN